VDPSGHGVDPVTDAVEVLLGVDGEVGALGAAEGAAGGAGAGISAAEKARMDAQLAGGLTGLGISGGALTLGLGAAAAYAAVTIADEVKSNLAQFRAMSAADAKIGIQTITPNSAITSLGIQANGSVRNVPTDAAGPAQA
jgi:hypothetical protein